MFSKLVLGLFSIILLLNINQVFADEELPIITIDFVSGSIIDLDEGPQMIRADIQIQNYNPQDGYHFMQVIRLNDNEILKDAEIMPKHIDENLFGVQIMHYLEPDENEDLLLGDYGLRIYSEFGTSDAVSTFSVIKSSMPVVVSQNDVEETIETKELENLTEELENFCFLSTEEQSEFFSVYVDMIDYEEVLSFICEIENENEREDAMYDFISDIEFAIEDDSYIETLEESEVETTEESEVETTEESKIPAWVHDLFVWYADEEISEDELLTVLEYLISVGILNVTAK